MIEKIIQLMYKIKMIWKLNNLFLVFNWHYDSHWRIYFRFNPEIFCTPPGGFIATRCGIGCIRTSGNVLFGNPM